ncbi:hypothetical protein PCANC_02780 [Puccinia coronata f. sp. avenae]|uniref:Hydrophobin n=1 Tax=Puccinia coronata f. sp. avenae TaxID=200324 RepID=A0A2N5W422_9BASI|nr:hypothetical protein PCANC_02780 [Puccinia coronata f. sp. avenae]
MQFSSPIALVALLLIHSQVVFSTFLCNDDSPFRSRAKVGYCIRKINNDLDNSFDTLQGWKKAGKTTIVEKATKSGSSGYSCGDFIIFGQAVERRVCCNLPKSQFTLRMASGYTDEEISISCYSR